MSKDLNKILNNFYIENSDNPLFVKKQYPKWHDTLNSKQMDVLELCRGENGNYIKMHVCIDTTYIYLGEDVYDKCKDLLVDAKEQNGKTRRKFKLISGHETEILARLGIKIMSDDINTPMIPKATSSDGFVIVCPRCENKFKKAERCPECGQLILY